MLPAIFATLTLLGLTDAQIPQPAESRTPELSAAEKLLAERAPEPQYAQKGIPLPTASALGAFRSPRWATLDADGFRGPVFAAPLPGRGTLPRGARLAAPVITPVVTQHGRLGYNVTPAGRVDVFDPVATRHPEDFVFGPASEPLPWKAWGSAEVLLGMTRGVNVPPVVTTGPAALGFGNAGALGNAGTVPLFGGGKTLDDWRAGFRGELGVWLDDAQVWGVFGRYYSLYSTSEQFEGTGNGTTVIALPRQVQILSTTIDFPIYISFPGIMNGSVSTTAQTNFAGGDLSVRRMLRQGAGWRLDGFAGYRQLHLGDELGVGFRAAPGATLINLPPGTPSPAFAGSDSQRTRNNFYGGQLGGVASLALGRWGFEGLGAVAIGLNASDLNNDRTRQVLIGGLTVPIVQTGVAERTGYFGTVWEGGVKVAYRVGDHLRLTMGYTGLTWWNLRRAQEQYDFRPSAILTGSTTGDTTHFYAHILSWGAELRY
jgi:hypothetical protein